MKTSTSFMPHSIAFFAACSDATCAANGVDFLDPLNPAAPDEDQQIVLPFGSVSVTTVLLNDAEMWTIPRVTCLIFFLDI